LTHTVQRTDGVLQGAMSSGDTSCREKTIFWTFRQLEDSMVKVCCSKKEHAILQEKNVPHFVSHFYLLYCLLLTVNKCCGERMKCQWLFYASHMASHSTEHIWNTYPSLVEKEKTKNSSGDEIANVNFLYDDIVHVLQNTIDSCINSATDRRGGYVLERMFTKFSKIMQCNGHYAVQGHSRSPILVPIESWYRTSYY